jgi:hypothetical protein
MVIVTDKDYQRRWPIPLMKPSIKSLGVSFSLGRTNQLAPVVELTNHDSLHDLIDLQLKVNDYYGGVVLGNEQPLLPLDGVMLLMRNLQSLTIHMKAHDQIGPPRLLFDTHNISQLNHQLRELAINTIIIPYHVIRSCGQSSQNYTSPMEALRMHRSCSTLHVLEELDLYTQLYRDNDMVQRERRPRLCIDVPECGIITHYA